MSEPSEVQNAEAELSMEEFFTRGNMRERGEEVPDLGADGDKVPAAVDAEAGKPAISAESPKPVDKRTREGRKLSIQQEMDAHVERRRVAKEEADAEETRLVTLRAEAKRLSQPKAAEPLRPQPQAVEPTDPEPKFEDYQTGGRLHNAADQDPYTTFIRASAGWEGRQAYRREASRVQAETFYQTRSTKLGEKLRAYGQKHPEFVNALNEKHADYGKLVRPDVADLKFSTPDGYGTPLGDLLVDSPHTAELLVHLSEHYDDFQRLSTLHPVLMARELGRIESRLDAALQPVPAPAVRVSTAKPPIKTVGSSPVVSDDAEDESELPIEDFIRVGNARDARHSSARH